MHWSYALQQGTFTLFPDTPSTMPAASAVALTMQHSSWRWPHRLGKQSPVSLCDMFSEPLLGIRGGAGAKTNLIQTSLRHQRISVMREVKGWPGGSQAAQSRQTSSSCRPTGWMEATRMQPGRLLSTFHFLMGPSLYSKILRDREKKKSFVYLEMSS